MATPKTRLPLMLTAIAIATANFMNILDTTIAVVSLPAISGSLGATPSQGAWVLTSYAVCLAIMLPLSGSVCKRYGEIKTFTVAITLFTLTSCLCGMASNFETLIFFRALQGLSSGLIVPLSQTVLLRIFPPQQHGFALGLWALTSGVAPVLGPIIGGYITDTIGWPWIFYMNVPVGTFCAWVIWTSMKHDETETKKVPIDVVGMLLLSIVVLLAQLVMDKGHELDWLGSPEIRLMLNIAVIGFIGFIVWERREPHPIVDYTLLKIPSFVICSIIAAIFYISYYTTTVLYPIWMQSVLGYTATWAGLAMAGTSLVPIFGMLIVGKHLAKLNLRHLMITGSGFIAYGIYLQALCTTETTFSSMFYARVIMGIGFGFMFPPLMALSLIGVPLEKTPSAAGFFNFFRMFSSSLGIAIGITVWQNRTIFHRQHLVENLTPLEAGKDIAFQPLIELAGDNEAVMWAMAERLSTLQASTLALSDTFIYCALAYIPVVLLTPFIPKRLPQRQDAGKAVKDDKELVLAND
jgi:DHA2 family multidrug resistance protein